MSDLTPRLNRLETGGAWKVGDIKQSFLTEAQFQAEHDNTWVLCDGRSVTGSDYETITSDSNIPDIRGQFLRGKNNGRNDGLQNPDGEMSLGQHTGDAIRNITGRIQSGLAVEGTPQNNGAFNGIITQTDYDINNGTGGSDYLGDFDFSASRVVPTASDNRPKNVTVNMYIKINREPTA